MLGELFKLKKDQINTFRPLFFYFKVNSSVKKQLHKTYWQT